MMGAFALLLIGAVFLFMQSREFYRRGPQHLNPEHLSSEHGPADISFLTIRRRFDFRGIQIGQWVSEAEKQKAGPLFFDALLDLMTILGATESLISLRGTLALQYGCGGQPGVSAHYESATRSFALAKNAGPGSIAHEWFHAFDHYISDKLFTPTNTDTFASRAWINDQLVLEHALNAKLEHCFQTIMLNETLTKGSDYFKRSLAMDKKMGSDYFSQPEELCARAFEAYVQDAPIKNNFLVTGTLQSQEAKMGLYPQGEHRVKINDAFAQYFNHLGHVLKHQEQRLIEV